MYPAETLKLLENLKAIGLSANEANLYLALLTFGTNPVSTIAKKAELNRSSCYEILRKLMEKGFISEINRKNITYFTPVEPKIMLKTLSNKKNDLDNKIENLKQSLIYLENIQCEYPQKPSVMFYEGEEGIRNIMEDTLTSNEPIRAYANLKELTSILPDYLPEYYKRRTERNIFVRAIYTADKDSYFHKLRDHLEKRESRLIPPEFDFSLDIIIYDYKVAITSLKDRFGLLITSASFAQTQKKLFDTIWDWSKNCDQLMVKSLSKKYGSAQKN
ncbi:hypothetical protein KJ951_04675 [Patescibacteria group bacterium]|nr:hypothetical protein [Patescibacteria group bacterium]MBU1703672.1 hypothetical protein [Patescibacteria group bacterium]MBU1953939.1 hypothetical protein [Patescibacteria group bacterium]